MDIISFNEAATANGRIEKFIENPDSNSGIVTVPKTIASGETITIPDGRVAVLPNVQVDGTLNVEGEVFIPSGSGLSTVVQKSGDTMTGNLNFASGTKITGDFSNATFANRVMFQTSSANRPTYVELIPNGTSTASSIIVSSNSTDVSNTSYGNLLISGSEIALQSQIRGTGTFLPITFKNGGAERMRIDTGGNVGIGRSSPYSKLHVADGPASATITLGASPTDGYHSIIYQNSNFMDFIANGDQAYRASLGTNNGSGYIRFFTAGSTTGNTERMRIDASGNVLAINSIGLGYGTGSGGTVTQLTSKSTAVTLNKPCGQITMNNAALAANTAVKFTLTNSLISSSQDLLIVNVVSGVTGFENYNVWGACWGGAATITLKNISAGSLSEAVVLEFVIIKGAVS